MRNLVLTVALCAAVIAPAAPAMAHAVPGAAYQVVLERSGGFVGGTTSFVVDRTVKGSARDLRLAGSPAFRRLGSSYQPANPCCDRVSYTVTVSYRGGGHKTVVTIQGTPAPRVLGDVIALTQKIGHQDQPLSVRPM